MEGKVKMSGVKKTVGKLFGKDKKKYKVDDSQAKKEIAEESDATKKQRLKLFYTAGEASGEEVDSVKKRKRLLGN